MIRAILRRSKVLLLALLFVIGLSTKALAAEMNSESVRLSTPDASGNSAFSVENMFPGDAETKDFRVEVSHTQPVTLYYRTDIRPGHEKLAEVMMTKIMLPEEGLVLYDGLMRDMPSALAHEMGAEEKEIIYRITVYLDTSVGNDYQYKSLIADFRWWYTEETQDSSGSGGGNSGGGSTPPPGLAFAAPVKLTAEKVLDGQYPRGNEFSFTLTDKNGKILQTVQNQDGMIEFDTLYLSKVGTHIYYIAEQPGDDDSILYDPSIYKAVVTVAKKNGFYSSSVSYERDGSGYLMPQFVNTSRENIPEVVPPPGPVEPDTPTDPTDPNVPVDPSVPSGPVQPVIPDNPKTGDETGITLYIVSFIVSLAALCCLLVLMKWKKKDGEA